ncbi:MAG: hypothetical protein ACOCV2_14740, partial [Persicimonas sp.]
MTARVVVGVMVGLLLLGALTIAAVQIPAVQQWLLDAGLERANDDLDGEVRADRLGGSMLADATLYDVDVDDARGNRVLRADQVRADYSIIELILGKNRLESVRLH